MENQQTVTLAYWDIRGLSERCRLLLEYCGVPYTQEFYSGPEDRVRMRNEVMPKLIEKNAAITLPYLLDGDKVISESDGICVYICFRGNKPELTGRNPEEKVMLATVHGVYKDYYREYGKLMYGSYNEENTF